MKPSVRKVLRLRIAPPKAIPLWLKSRNGDQVMYQSSLSYQDLLCYEVQGLLWYKRHVDQAQDIWRNLSIEDLPRLLVPGGTTYISKGRFPVVRDKAHNTSKERLVIFAARQYWEDHET
jgi:hypothetical protein